MKICEISFFNQREIGVELMNADGYIGDGRTNLVDELAGLQVYATGTQPVIEIVDSERGEFQDRTDLVSPSSESSVSICWT